MKKITIVSSCYNEYLNLDELYERCVVQTEKFKDKYEFDHILLDNGSTDNTALKLKELAKKDKRIKVIINARNFGHIRSPFYGMLQTDADAVIYIASDLQDPPELIPSLIEKWEEGYKTVLLQKNESKENPLKFLLRKFYYFILDKLNDSEAVLPKNCTGSGLFDKAVIDELKKIDDPYPFVRGLLSEIGYKTAYVPFVQPVRKNGFSANGFYSLYDLGVTGIIKHSKIPLRIMVFLGFSMSALMFILTLFYFFWKLLYWDKFSFGLAPVIISILFTASVQLFCLGILGEYIGAIHTRIDKKPLVTEEERINF